MGCFVVAVVFAEDPEPFTRCCGVPNVTLRGAEVSLAADDPLRARLWPPDGQPGDTEESAAVLAAVTLGACGVAFYTAGYEGGWTCTRDDLLDDGKALVDLLERQFARPVHLVTFVDT